MAYLFNDNRSKQNLETDPLIIGDTEDKHIVIDNDSIKIIDIN